MEFPFCERAEQYVEGVLSGTIIACKWIRLACQRHRNDLARIGDPDWPYYFDHEAAERAIRFASRFPHLKGKWAAQRGPSRLFNPEPWQCFWYASIFGWKNITTGMRRFRKARGYIPRKNGKSFLAAPMGLYMFAADGEPGAEVYSGATNEKQAWEIFGPAKQMANLRPDFRERYGVEVNAKSLVIEGEMAKFEPVVGKPGDGASPHCSITDEYHEHVTDDQLSTFETGMGARDQPLSVVVSTAGDNIAGPCRADWLDCQAMLEGTEPDETLFALIFTVDDEKEWAKPESLIMANPNWGVSVNIEKLLHDQQIAARKAAKQGHFKIKHLNIWVQARNQFFNIEGLRQSIDRTITYEGLRGKLCTLGMDLASKNDLASVMYEFWRDDGHIILFGRHYLPRARVDEPDATLYRAWEKDGWITVTEGNQTDYRVIYEDIKADSKHFELVDGGFDPHNATMLTTMLMDLGIEMIEYTATTLNFSEPMKELQVLMDAGKIHTNGDPVIEWAFSNVLSKTDAKDNEFPRKEKYEKKIDPAVAAIMAHGRRMQNDLVQGDSDGFFSNPARAG